MSSNPPGGPFSQFNPFTNEDYNGLVVHRPFDYRPDPRNGSSMNAQRQQQSSGESSSSQSKSQSQGGSHGRSMQTGGVEVANAFSQPQSSPQGQVPPSKRRAKPANTSQRASGGSRAQGVSHSQPTPSQPPKFVATSSQPTPHQPKFVAPPAIPTYKAMETAKQSGFPMFHDGDLLIVSPSGKQWKLHTHVLASHSPVLNKILTEAEPAKLTPNDVRNGKTVFYKLEMYNDAKVKQIDPAGERFKAFRAVSVDARVFNVTANINGQGTKPRWNRNYNNFFRCVYNMKPEIAEDEDALARAYIVDCTGLLTAAELLGAASVVRIAVEAHLLRLNQVIWHHISEKAENWIHIAAVLQSPLLFRECMVHLVGKYHLKDAIDMSVLRDPVHGAMGDKVWDLIQLKAGELKEKKLQVERQLLEFFPERLLHNDDSSSVPGRAIYANDIWLWMGLTLCRQYCGSAYTANLHHRASDGGMHFYRSIGGPKPTWIDPPTLERYHVSFDMSTKAKVCLNNALDAIKSEYPPIFKDLLADRTQATRAADATPFGHFVCTEILDEELPWYEPPADFENDDENDAEAAMAHMQAQAQGEAMDVDQGNGADISGH